VLSRKVISPNDRDVDGAVKLREGWPVVGDGFLNVILSRILGATPLSIRTPPPEENPPLERGLIDGALLMGLEKLGALLIGLDTPGPPPNPAGGDDRIWGAGLGAADLMPCSLDLPLPRSFGCACAGEPGSRTRAAIRPTRAPLHFNSFFSIVNICSFLSSRGGNPSTATIHDRRRHRTHSCIPHL
jgi:hypothetical protein